MSTSVLQFLDRTATRGSWYGGGSAAALTAATAAALLEKLASRPALARSIRVLRGRCVAAIDGDAQAFARVIKAYYQQDRGAVKRTLKRAIEVPVSVHHTASRLLALAREVKRSVPSKYQSDLRCVVAMATAARDSAAALVATNLDWLADAKHARRVRKQLARPA